MKTESQEVLLNASSGGKKIAFKLSPQAIFLGLIILFFLGGCSSHKLAADPEASSALTSVAGYYAGRQLSEAEMKELSSQIQKDKEAQLVLEQLNQALTPEPQFFRYCPIDGQRFSHRVEVCPVHKVKLKNLEE